MLVSGRVSVYCIHSLCCSVRVYVSGWSLSECFSFGDALLRNMFIIYIYMHTFAECTLAIYFDCKLDLRRWEDFPQ